MRQLFPAVIFFLTIIRLGNVVSWNIKILADRLSNKQEGTYLSSVEVCSTRDVVGDSSTFLVKMFCAFRSYSEVFKRQAALGVYEVLPSPHSELVLGMVLGENQFKLVPTYNDVLKEVGLVHVVVVSGYNISLVFTLLMRILGSQYKVKNLVIGLIATLFYAGISGFGIPAVRAWLMGSIAVLFKFYGKPSQGIHILIVTALVLIIIAPNQLFSVSFQLSFLATLGVMTLPDIYKHILRVFGFTRWGALAEDLCTSLGAQTMVNPVISYYFGTVSLAALIANPLILWVVPLCTILGGVLILISIFNMMLSQIMAIIIYPFLDYFVICSEYFASFNTAALSIRVTPYTVLTYYALLFIFYRFMRRKIM